METFEEHYASMMDTIRKRMPGADLAIVDKAVDYAKAKHASQKRKDGSPYIIHPLAVAQIVTEMGLDIDACPVIYLSKSGFFLDFKYSSASANVIVTLLLATIPPIFFLISRKTVSLGSAGEK